MQFILLHAIWNIKLYHTCYMLHWTFQKISSNSYRIVYTWQNRTDRERFRVLNLLKAIIVLLAFVLAKEMYNIYDQR